MRRFLFEILDQSWCPRPVRDGVTDALEAVVSYTDVYRSVRAQFLTAIRGSGAERVVDLCSGGGGPWLSLPWRTLLEQSGLCAMLTDKFPSKELGARVAGFPRLVAVDSSVDATDVPPSLRGFRTVFSSFHHFPDSLAIRILGDVVRSGDGLASAEVTSRSLRAFLVMFLMPLFVWALTPRIRPFRWSRLLLTYLIPAIPFVIFFDGIVSCLRTRTPEELLLLTGSFPEYEWTSGYAHGARLPPVYLIGVPRDRTKRNPA